MKLSPLAVFLTIGLLVAAVAIPAARQANETKPGQVEAVVLSAENWKEYAPQGKEVDAIYGDIVLRNEHLVAVIADPKPTRNANMTVKQVGGALIDFTTRKNPSDQLSAFYPGKRNYALAPAVYSFAVTHDQVELVAKGEIDVQAKMRGDAVAFSVEAPAADAKPAVTTTYSLQSGSRHLDVITTFQNPHNGPVTFELADDARIDAGKEDLQKSPNGESRFFWAYDRFWNQAYGLSLIGNDHVPGDILMNSDARVSTFQYRTLDGKTAVTLASGESFTLTRQLWAGADLLDVLAIRAKSAEAPLKQIHVVMQDKGGRPLDRALVELFDESDKFYGSARTSADGQLSAELPHGRYSVRVTALGRRIDQDKLRLDVAENRAAPSVVKFDQYVTGQVDVHVIDGSGQPIPCKAEFRSSSGETVDFGPESSEFAVRNLRYAPHGKFTQRLPAGDYELVVSHGPEYEIAKQTIRIDGGKTTPVAVRLNRVVNTAGWVSSDFHSHSTPSGDNTSSQLGRVLNLVAEHIEFAPCTEHNRVDTYVPHIEELGIQKFIATVSGMELTGQPLPLNHQNAFPLKMTPHTQDNGAPLVLDNLEDQIERLALWDDRSEKLVQVNHPDLGWMFYDKNGDGQPDGGFERAFPFMNVVEIHPVDSALHLGPVREFANGSKFHNTIFRWLQLLNQGYRIYGVVNTDAHYNFHGSGGLRNWIQSSTDDPAKIDPMEMVRAAKEGRLTVSNGPFLEVWAGEPGQTARVTCGQDLLAKSKRITLKVKAQSPAWFGVNRVFVLVNGRVDPKHDYSREKTPNVFRSGVLKFDESLELELARDSHVIVVAGEVGGSFQSVMGPNNSEPAALTNPIYVDIDGNGFEPSKDTLDHPLPVKFNAGK